MDAVPNAAFDASFPPDVEFEHPSGCYLARKLQQSLAAVASTVQDFVNWRDVGWVVTCVVDGCRFEIYFAGAGSAPTSMTWMLGVAPVGQPGSIRRLFGAKASPYKAQSKLLTAHVHKLLVGDTHVSNVRWAMNADPSESRLADPSELPWGSGDVA